MGQHEVAGVSIGIGAVVNGAAYDGVIIGAGELAVSVVDVGGDQAGWASDASHLLAAVVGVNGLFPERVVVGEHLVVGVVVIAGNLDAESILAGEQVNIVGGIGKDVGAEVNGATDREGAGV